MVALCPGFSCKGSSEFASSNICKARCLLSKDNFFSVYRQYLIIPRPLGLENIFLGCSGH